MPSIHEDPIELHRTPRQSRLQLYNDVGRAIEHAEQEFVTHARTVADRTDENFFKHLAAEVVKELVHKGYEFLLNDKLVDLSRFEEVDDPRHTWLR